MFSCERSRFVQTSHMQDLQDFLSPINIQALHDDNGFTDGQLAKTIACYESHLPDISHADFVIVGIGETRGAGYVADPYEAPDAIRKQLYKLLYWHTDISIADVGNIKPGAHVSDSYAALKSVVSEIIRSGKIALILGGSHDITLAQYHAYVSMPQVIEATCIDAMIDLRNDSPIRSENFLLEMLTSEPNMVRHYNHVGFQSYFVHPRLLETMDKLRFDCWRVGMAKENIEETEPAIRNSQLVSFDINAIKNSDSPASTLGPNGFSGEEACMIARFAGMSNKLSSFGIYGYNPSLDLQDLSAKQIAQMIWYFIDGRQKNKLESKLEDTAAFNQFHTCFAEVDTVFLQSKRSNRWWMQMPDKKFIACSQNDYIKASRNEIPERWLRTQERN